MNSGIDGPGSCQASQVSLARRPKKYKLETLSIGYSLWSKKIAKLPANAPYVILLFWISH